MKNKKFKEIPNNCGKLKKINERINGGTSMEIVSVICIVIIAICSAVKTVIYLINKEYLGAIAYAVLSLLAIVAFMIRL